jgi:hypothetical protein
MIRSDADLDHVHNGLMRALRSIQNGGGLNDGVSIPPFGQTSTVGAMLALASQHLDDHFHEEELDTVQSALHVAGTTHQTSSKREVALTLLQKLAKQA